MVSQQKYCIINFNYYLMFLLLRLNSQKMRKKKFYKKIYILVTVNCICQGGQIKFFLLNVYVYRKMSIILHAILMSAIYQS